MKKVTCLIIQAVLSVSILSAQQPRQKISFPVTKDLEACFRGY